MSNKKIIIIGAAFSAGVILILGYNHWCNMSEIRLKHENEMEEEKQSHLHDKEFLNMINTCLRTNE